MRTSWMTAGLFVLLVLFSTSPARAVEARSETLWIFDADFEDLQGDNVGWVSEDLSGTPGVENYWHKDTIRINGFAHLRDSTWWCGKSDSCWLQPRGYGNNWCELMWRDFPLSEWSDPGDAISLEWDQRFAMEKDYDYGYVEISDDAGTTWTVIYTANNPGFPGKPGTSQDWDSVTHGHVDVSSGIQMFAGVDVCLRFRFESDGAYSCQDAYVDPPAYSVTDGAWQLDNIEWGVNGASVWLDDCESPGDNGWQHPDIPASGQTGIAFRRSLETVMGDPRWMMVAYDEGTGLMVDGQFSSLVSPPIGIADEDALVAEWSGWIDLPYSAHDLYGFHVATGNVPGCIEFSDWDPSILYYGGPNAYVMQDDWDVYTGNAWLQVDFRVLNSEPGTGHGVGFMLDRFRLGVPMETHIPDEPVFATRLFAPSPNPFNPTTTVSYTVGVSGHVTIRVHDLAGRVVRTLVDASHDAGEFEIIWNGTTDGNTRAASGVYFVGMESDGRKACHKEVRKLVLLK
ncbi:immune inhibitor A [bacterium]|nr:immune inhibitor A [bacterium]